jgi:hypothetical protein
MIHLPLTRFKCGLAFLAAFDAPRDDEARIASADFLETPSLLAILDATRANPPFFAISVPMPEDKPHGECAKRYDRDYREYSVLILNQALKRLAKRSGTRIHI